MVKQIKQRRLRPPNFLVVNLNTLLTIIVTFIFISLCTSKAGVNISLALVVIISLIYLFQKKDEYFRLAKEKPLSFSLVTFIIGIFTSYISNIELNELKVFLSKGILFFCLPGLILLLNNKMRQKTAFYAYFSGLLLAMIYAIYNWHNINDFRLISLEATRVDSFWDLGRWTEILVYSLSIMIPFIFESKENMPRKATLSLLSFFCFFCMIISGGRAAIVALGITSSLYLLFRRPKVMLAIVTLLAITFGFFSSSPVVKPIYERIISITNTHNQYSNIARLVMWKNSIEIIYEKLNTEPYKIFFGSGPNHFEIDIKNHLRKKGLLESISNETKNQFSFTDSHNTYLDLANKNGFIYLFSYIVTLISFYMFFIKYLKTHPMWSFSGIGLISNHIIFGFFYTSGLQFQTIVLFFLICLCFSNIYLSKRE